MTQIAIHDDASNAERLRNYLMDRTVDLDTEDRYIDEATVTHVSGSWLFVRLPEWHGGHAAKFRLSDIHEITIQS